MKTCTKCKNSKDESAFSQHKGGLRSKCKDCCSDEYAVWCAKNRDQRRVLDNRHYSIHPEKKLMREKARYAADPGKVATRNRELVEAKRKVVIAAKAGGCTRCSEHDPRCLDFHHARGEKKYNVSTLVAGTASMQTLLSELAKCDILCANCHRKQTSKDRDFFYEKV